MKQFLHYCWGMFTRPRSTFDALAAEKSVRWGIVAAFLGTFEVWGNIALNAIFGYDWLGTRGILPDPTLVAGFGHWRVNLSEYVPVLVILMPIAALFGFCVTCGVAQLMSKLWGGRGTFEQMVNALSFAAVPAVVIATFSEWIFGVPIAMFTGERYWWTDAMAGKFGIVSIIWNIWFWGVYIILAYTATIALGSIAIRRIQKIPAWAAVVTMITLFVLVMFLDSFIIR